MPCMCFYTNLASLLLIIMFHLLIFFCYSFLCSIKVLKFNNIVLCIHYQLINYNKLLFCQSYKELTGTSWSLAYFISFYLLTVLLLLNLVSFFVLMTQICSLLLWLLKNIAVKLIINNLKKKWCLLFHKLNKYAESAYNLLLPPSKFYIFYCC